MLIRLEPPPTKKNFAPMFEFNPTKSICFLIKFKISSNLACTIFNIKDSLIFLKEELVKKVFIKCEFGSKSLEFFFRKNI